MCEIGRLTKDRVALEVRGGPMASISEKTAHSAVAELKNEREGQGEETWPSVTPFAFGRA
jgi:hypothetical protein